MWRFSFYFHFVKFINLTYTCRVLCIWCLLFTKKMLKVCDSVIDLKNNLIYVCSPDFLYPNLVLFFFEGLLKLNTPWLWGIPFLLFPLTVFLLINNPSPDIHNTVGSVSLYNYILVLPSWVYTRVILI